MAGRLQMVHQWPPDPCAGKRAVYNDKSRHSIPVTSTGYRLVGSQPAGKSYRRPALRAETTYELSAKAEGLKCCQPANGLFDRRLSVILRIATFIRVDDQPTVRS